MPVNPALDRLRQEDCRLKASLSLSKKKEREEEGKKRRKYLGSLKLAKRVGSTTSLIALSSTIIII
jgi:hypothetical protein